MPIKPSTDRDTALLFSNCLTVKKTLTTGIIILLALAMTTQLSVAITSQTTDDAPEKTLRFPTHQVTGQLYAGPPIDTSDSAKLPSDEEWKFIGFAKGQVKVPANRIIQLSINLGSDPNSNDLSCLQMLGPNDLYKLKISSWIRRKAASRPKIETISHLTGLKVLMLNQTSVTSQQLASLKTLTSLSSLSLYYEHSVGSNGLAVLKNFPELQYLDCYTNPTDIGVKHISQLKNLRQLRIRMGRIRGPGLKLLAQMPRLEQLTLWGTSGLSDQHVKFLEGLTNLKTLKLWGGNNSLSDISLNSISKMSSLEELYFIRIKTEFFDAGIAKLTALPNLRILETSPKNAAILTGMKKLESIKPIPLDSNNMKALQGLKNLKALGLSLTKNTNYQTDDPVAALAKIKSLEKIYVVNSYYNAEAFGDKELAHLESLPNLKELSVPLGNISDQGWASIGRLKQLQTLEISFNKQNSVSISNLNQLNNLKNLERLKISINTAQAPLKNDTDLNLSNITRLKHISLSSVHLKQTDWAFLANQKKLEELWLNNCYICPENGLKYIKDLPELKTLDLQNIKSKGNDLAHLETLKSLDRIRLIGRVTDNTLTTMPKLPLLRMFDVKTDVKISSETIAHLKRNLPSVSNININ